MLNSNRISLLLNLLALFLIGVIEAYLVSGDFNIRMALPPQDESPIAHSIYYINPGQFYLDAYMNVWSPIAIKSLINWFPALMMQYFDIDPNIFFVLFILLQTSLMVVSIYLLVIFTFHDRMLAWFSAIFILIWRPHWINIALISGLDWMPYANWFALPFILLGIAFTVNRQNIIGIIFIVFSGLIHPIMASLGLLMVIFLHTKKISDWQYKSKAFAVAIIVISLAITFISINESGENQVDITKLLSNPHINPISAGFPYGVAALSNALIWIIALYAIAFSGAGKNLSAIKILVCSGGVVIITCLVHFSSIALEIGPIINLILTRSSILAILITIPFVLNRLISEMSNLNPLRVLGALIVVFSCSAISLVGIALLEPPKIKGEVFKNNSRLSFIRNIVGSFFLGVALIRHYPEGYALIESVVPIELSVMLPWIMSDNRKYLFNTLLLIPLIFIILINLLCLKLILKKYFYIFKKYSGYVNITLVMVSLLLVGTLENISTSRNELSIEAIDYYKAQIWALENSHVNSAFINTGVWPTIAWRGVARRQTVSTFYIGGVYRSSEYAKQYNSRMDSFKNKHGINNNDANEWNLLNEKDWLEFRREFGGDYLVRRAEHKILSFTIVYKNDNFLIYSFL